MKILYVCHRLPFPPRRGGKIRPFNMIRHLHATHEVTVASLARSAHELAEGQGLGAHCSGFEVARVRNPVQVARMIARLASREPSSFGFFHSRDLARRIDRLVRDIDFDLIFVHCSSVAHYVAHVDGVPKILDFGDMDSQKWREYARSKPFPVSLGYRLEGAKLGAEERRLARRFDLCTATTRAEWQTLESYGTGVATDWFPNGVDADYFAPASSNYDPNALCFVGRMDYFPNQACMTEFCRDIWPLIRARRPAATLDVVGADPSPAIRNLASIAGVRVTGSVPDVRPFLARSAAMVAPLRIARGTQNKILEAMAAGTPVVTSSVAAGGVDALPGEHFLVADRAEDIATAALELMSNPARRAQLAQAARTRVLADHSWASSMRRLDGIIERCMHMHYERGRPAPSGKDSYRQSTMQPPLQPSAHSVAQASDSASR